MCLPPCLCLGQHWAQCPPLGHDPDSHTPCQDALLWQLAIVLGAWGEQQWGAGCSLELSVLQEGKA